MKKSIIQCVPFVSPKVWGYEKWLISTHKNGHSLVLPQNNTLAEILQGNFPLLIKYIHAAQTLSVQVHPDNEYARMYENDSGKTECWYIAQAAKGAELICGVRMPDGSMPSREQLAHLIASNQVESCLQRISVSVGDMIYIPAGTVHAILGGIDIIEIQQSSDVTYRLYDWGRDREIHVEKSLDVIDYEGHTPYSVMRKFTHLECPYFAVEKVTLHDTVSAITDSAGEYPLIFIALEGTITISAHDTGEMCMHGAKTDTFMVLPHTSVSLKGDGAYLRVSI